MTSEVIFKEDLESIFGVREWSVEEVVSMHKEEASGESKIDTKESNDSLVEALPSEFDSLDKTSTNNEEEN